MDLEPVGPGDRRASCDEGYTLVEVVVALVLVMILVLSAAQVLTTATARAAVLQQQQTAPLVANQTMERVKAVTALPTASLVTGLVQGRGSDEVTAQWNAAAGVPVVTSVLASAWPAADPGAAGGRAVQRVASVLDHCGGGQDAQAALGALNAAHLFGVHQLDTWTRLPEAVRELHESSRSCQRSRSPACAHGCAAGGRWVVSRR